MADTIIVEVPVATVLEVSGLQGPQGPTGPQGPSGDASGSTNASLLTSGTLADARLSAAVTTSLGKADSASQPGHTHTASDIASGTLDNARVNWAAPSALGSTTAAAATVTDLKADTLTMPKSGQPTILANVSSGNLSATGQISAATLTTSSGGSVIVASGGALRLDSGAAIVDPTDTSKKLALNLSGISASTTRTFTAPNASGRIQIEGQPIGDTTPAAGTFTTLISSGDTEVTDSAKGIILKSPNNTRWRVTINDDGTLSRAALGLMTLLAFATSGFAQIRDMVTDTNGNIVTGRTNALAFTNSVAFSNPITFGTNAPTTRTNLGVTVASNLPAPYSGASASNSLLTADGAGGSSFVANRLSVSGLTTNVVRTSWANVGADKATNDTGLSLSYAANSVYRFKWSVFVSSTWSNVAYGIAFNGTNSFAVRNGYQVTPSSSTPSGATVPAGVTNATLVSDSTSSYAAPVYVGGEIVFFSTNSGTLNFRFWTTASNTNTSTLFSNSIISLEKLYP